VVTSRHRHHDLALQLQDNTKRNHAYSSISGALMRTACEHRYFFICDPVLAEVVELAAVGRRNESPDLRGAGE
jgi:hypothetical protein